MNAEPASPAWLAHARAKAQQAPRAPREALLTADGHRFGSVQADLMEKIAHWPAKNGHLLLQKGEQGWRLTGDTQSGLDGLADALRACGRHGPWRGEALAVRDSRGYRLGRIERGTVRALGIATQAVHLIGLAPSGGHWVQQRALTKANDPGLWDTLMGGMVADGESIDQALERETWEEAGLRPESLTALTPGGDLWIRRPSDEVSGGGGYMVERITWFHATVPAGLSPHNRDGEVARFESLDRPALLARLEEGAFTLEATLVLGAWLLA